MIDLRNNITYTRARNAELKLSQGLVWLDTFRQPSIRTMILDWIREDQLTRKGVDADGNVIGYYSLVTSFINPNKKFNTPFTLNDTGDFYRSMFITVLVDALIINADAEKMEDQEWWNERILELTDENLEKLKALFLERLQDYGRDVLLGRR